MEEPDVPYICSPLTVVEEALDLLQVQPASAAVVCTCGFRKTAGFALAKAYGSAIPEIL